MPKAQRLTKPQIATLRERGLASLCDNAGQTVFFNFLPSYNDAKRTLQNIFKVTDSDTAMRNFSAFHVQTIGQMDRYTHASPPDADQFHAFHSLIYHLLPKGAQNNEFRQAINDTFTALQLPPLLTEEQVCEKMAEIIAFTTPKLETAIE